MFYRYTNDPEQPSQDLNLQFQNQNLVCCQLHQRAMTGLSGYDPKSEVLETTMLSVYTTDLKKLLFRTLFSEQDFWIM